MLPSVSRMLRRGLAWACRCSTCARLRALLNNLQPRLSQLRRPCRPPRGAVARRRRAAHAEAARRRTARHPAHDAGVARGDAGLARRRRVTDLLRDVRAVVVDEVHAFAGDDRGWHLLAVLERVSAIAGRELQRIGLSATVGNPDELLEWLAGMHGRAPACRRSRARWSRPNPSLTIDYVGTLDNAATRHLRAAPRREAARVLRQPRASRGARGCGFGSLGVATFVSHRSLGLDERRRAEQAFAEGTNCVIVATSTLELGIDVGDLDRVIQIDAPSTVASFLQRLGRTGRRPGTRRNCLFLATDDESLLRACALTQPLDEGLRRAGGPAAGAATTCSRSSSWRLRCRKGRIGRRLWREWIGRMPAFAAMDDEDALAVVGHLVEAGWLHDDEGLLAIGPEAERSLGWRHFVELTGIVSSDPEIIVRYGQSEIGRVHPLSFRRSDGDYTPILLGGRSWRVTSIDWSRRIAHVAPDPRPGKSRWRGDARAVEATLCRGMRSILAGTEAPVRLTRRGETQMSSLREQFWWASDDATTLVSDGDGRALVDVRRPPGERATRRPTGRSDARGSFARQPLDSARHGRAVGGCLGASPTPERHRRGPVRVAGTGSGCISEVL